MPSPFSNSPLFRTASAQIRNTARQQLRNTVLFRAFDEIQRCGHSGTDQKRRLESTLVKYSKMDLRRALGEISSTSIGEVVRECAKYSKGGMGGMFLRGLFQALGPTGKILEELVGTVRRGGGLSREIEFATKLLESQGYRVIRPPGAGRQIRPAGTSLADFLDELRASGYGIPVAEGTSGKRGQGKLPGGVPETTTKGEPRRFVDIDAGPGAGRRRVPVNHPVVTGDFVRAPKSSTVYEFGYDIDNLLLYVRFYAPVRGGGKRTAPGSLYQYSGVTPEEFLSLYKTKGAGHKSSGREHLSTDSGPIGGDASPGTWVWDHLRERGTVSGHKKDYRLAGIMGSYVPRKAVLTAEGEWYQTRTIRTTGGKMMQSTLQPRRADSLINRRLDAANMLRPSGAKGKPQRPNPGTPNRGL